MVSAELVTPVSIATLVCPYCCRPMPRDVDGMRAAHSAWGFCAGLARENGHVIGLVLVAPIEWRGRAAARITTGWVAPGHCASGVGRALVRGVAGGLLKARATVVLARADVALGCAALPAGFLAATGFAAQAAAPLWALDLTTAVRAAKPSVLDRLGRLVQSVGPLAPPEPAHNGVVPPR